MIVEPARQLALVQQHGAATASEQVGILPLVIVGSLGIGEQNGGQAGGGKLGQGGAALSRQTARSLCTSTAGKSATKAVTTASTPSLRQQLAGGPQIGFARLMEGLPPRAGELGGRLARPVYVFVEPRPPRLPPRHEELRGRSLADEGIWAARGADAVDWIAGHAQGAAVAEFGLRLRELRTPARPWGPASGWPCPRHVLLQQDQPDAASHGRPAHGHAGVAAQSGHGADLFLLEEAFGGQEADEVFQSNT